MRCFKTLLIGLYFLLAGCGEQSSLVHRALPFPTPAQHDLIVVTTPGPLTYTVDHSGAVVGLEHDLIEAFAAELGVGVRYEIVAPEEIEAAISAGKAHIAAGWLHEPLGTDQRATPPILQTRDVIVQHEASLPLEEHSELIGKTIHVMAGSRQLETLRAIQQSIPEMNVVEVSEGDVFALLSDVGNRKIELAAVDSSLVEIASQIVPTLQNTLELSDEVPVVWWLGTRPNAELAARVSAFVDKVQRDGTLARLEDRYFGHVRRLKQADIVKYLGRVETMLPKLRPHFHAAQIVSGLDWRLIAAVAYHESQWEPDATSPTGVRGIMMLTAETADRLGVSNRLDPRESIIAGARYLNMLKDFQPDDVMEPDRTWMALASYNIGPGHFNVARTLARQEGADPAAWYEMKRILPLLAQPKYYERLKSGRARGGEAVFLVENIRSYYDILVRHETAYQPSRRTVEAMLARNETRPGLKLKQPGGPSLKAPVNLGEDADTAAPKESPSAPNDI